MSRLAAPVENGGILAEPGFDAVPKLVEENRKRLDTAFPEFRRVARQDLHVGDEPLILTGHQPELHHPGVWVKNFAAAGIATRLHGTAFHLTVDTDTVKSTTIRLPRVTDETVTLASLPFDDYDGETPYEFRPIRNHALFDSLDSRLCEATASWPFSPIGLRRGPSVHNEQTNLGNRLRDVTQSIEELWGASLRSIPVSQFQHFQSFRGFVLHLMEDHERFRSTYNAAIQNYRRNHKLRSRNHPAAELEPGELPFWTIEGTSRRRTWIQDRIDYKTLRPKALILTLFVRLILGDFFIHGLGGGKYDEVTDTIIRNYFKIEPPAFQILTATLHLPFPASAISKAELIHDRRIERERYWNPHRLLVDGAQAHCAIRQMPTSTHRERGLRFKAFRKLADELRPRLASWQSQREAILHGLASVAILRRRDYAWILYPEEQLKPFLQPFLEPWRLSTTV